MSYDNKLAKAGHFILPTGVLNMHKELCRARLFDLVDQLVQTLGVWPACDTSHMRELYESGKYGECIAAIKNHFGLPLSLRVCYHNIQGSDPLTNSMKLLYLLGEPAGTVIAMESRETLRSLANMPAAVLLSGNLPPLGTEAFAAAQEQLMINKDTLTLPFYCFAYAIGHEMSHILLKAMRHPAESELAADILPLLRGFTKEVIAAKIHTGSDNLGYLPTSEFVMIARYIDRY